MEFKVGQRVAYLHESGYGVILEIAKDRMRVEDENGFDRWLPKSELVFIHSEKYADEEVVITKEDLEPEQTFRVVEQRTGQRKPQIVWEIDLHIEELIDSHAGMSNTEILLKQMSEFRSIFKKGKKELIHKLIVIHGVGEGVLKNEIRSFLAKQDQIDVYDADFSEYGKGATAIEFHPNWQ
jgi:dsDNA-specific endonuclease/ATPase MutS2